MAPPPGRGTAHRAADADASGGHGGHLRRLNLERVQAYAMDHPGPFNRAALIQATGLSSPTVGSLVSQLIRRGLVRDLGTGPSRGGRKPFVMEFNARYGFVAGIALGSTKTHLAVADLRGERLAQLVIPTPSDLGPRALLTHVATATRSLLRETNVPQDRLLALGVGAPGAVDRERGVVVALAPNLKGWSNVPVGAILKKALGASVVVENDVNLAVLGERWRGGARGHDTCAFVRVGTGIGAGIMSHGLLHRGHRCLAGEIALMCMGPQFVETDFGSRGCLETLAGLKALSSSWPHRAGDDPERWLAEMFEAARRGNRRVRKAVDRVATLVGIAIANLSLVLDPSLIVLDGVVPSQGPYFVQQVRRIVHRLIPARTEIVVSTLGEEATLWGSLLIARDEAWDRLRPSLKDARASA